MTPWGYAKAHRSMGKRAAIAAEAERLLVGACFIYDRARLVAKYRCPATIVLSDVRPVYEALLRGEGLEGGLGLKALACAELWCAAHNALSDAWWRAWHETGSYQPEPPLKTLVSELIGVILEAASVRGQRLGGKGGVQLPS